MATLYGAEAALRFSSISTTDWRKLSLALLSTAYAISSPNVIPITFRAAWTRLSELLSIIRWLFPGGLRALDRLSCQPSARYARCQRANDRREGIARREPARRCRLASPAPGEREGLNPPPPSDLGQRTCRGRKISRPPSPPQSHAMRLASKHPTPCNFFSNSRSFDLAGKASSPTSKGRAFGRTAPNNCRSHLHKIDCKAYAEARCPIDVEPGPTICVTAFAKRSIILGFYILRGED